MAARTASVPEGHHGAMSPGGHDFVERLPAELAGQQAILRRLLLACEADDRIRWLVVSCSVGRGAADRLSDLDLGMGIRDEQFDAALPDIRRAVGELGDLVDSYHHSLAGLTSRHERIFAQFADRCQVDLVVIAVSDAFGKVRDEVVLYDPDGRRSAVFAARPLTPERVREWAFSGWCALADLGKYLRRGSLWEAHERLNQARSSLWQLHAAACDVPSPEYGLTSILDFAPERMPAEFAAAVAGLDAERLAAAARHLASQLRDVGGRLAPEMRALLPTAMASFVIADLALLSA
jgi:hypothetical protein